MKTLIQSAIVSHVIFDCNENINIENEKLLQQANDDRQLHQYGAVSFLWNQNKVNESLLSIIEIIHVWTFHDNMKIDLSKIQRIVSKTMNEP